MINHTLKVTLKKKFINQIRFPKMTLLALLKYQRVTNHIED